MAPQNRIVRLLDAITRPETEALTAERGPLQQLRSIVADPNVIGAGVSEKVSGGRSTGKLALVFYVKRKLAPSKLRSNVLIPLKVRRDALGGPSIHTDVVELGPLHLDGAPLATRQPIQPGNSLGHIACLAGTLGAIVKRGKEIYLLSNAHVLAAGEHARKGDPILYPARGDRGRRPRDVVGKLADALPFQPGGAYVNVADCAVAQLTRNGRPLVSDVRIVGGPTGIVQPRRGMRIIKVGRTTGRTTGTIRDIHFRFTLPYPGLGNVGFRDQVLCSRYSAAGDSGSLVLEERTGRAVGLHFASAANGSVFSPIRSVLRSLRVRLVLAKKLAERSKRQRK